MVLPVFQRLHPVQRAVPEARKVAYLPAHSLSDVQNCAKPSGCFYFLLLLVRTHFAMLCPVVRWAIDSGALAMSGTDSVHQAEGLWYG